MAQLGTVQTVVVCVPGESGQQGVCPAGHVQSVTQGYLVAPSEAVRFDLMATPFDSAQAASFYAYGFGSTLMLWLFAYGIGRIIKMVGVRR